MSAEPTPVVSAAEPAEDSNVTLFRGHSTALVPVPPHVAPAIFALKDRKPAIWTEPRPALEEVWKYGKHGQYTGQKGAMRRAGQAYAGLVIGVTGLTYWFLWAIQKPSRAGVTALGVTLFILTIRAL